MIEAISAKELLEKLTANKEKVVKRGSGDGGYGKKIGEVQRLCSDLEDKVKQGFVTFAWNEKVPFAFWNSKIEDLELYLQAGN